MVVNIFLENYPERCHDTLHNDIQHNIKFKLCIMAFYAYDEYHYAKCHFAECRGIV